MGLGRNRAEAGGNPQSSERCRRPSLVRPKKKIPVAGITGNNYYGAAFAMVGWLKIVKTAEVHNVVTFTYLLGSELNVVYKKKNSY